MFASSSRAGGDRGRRVCVEQRENKTALVRANIFLQRELLHLRIQNQNILCGLFQTQEASAKTNSGHGCRDHLDRRIVCVGACVRACVRVCEHEYVTSMYVNVDTYYP